MPILTKEVEVKVESKTVEHYKSLGYEVPMKKATESSYKKYKKEFVYDFSKTITVKVEDLPLGSHIKIEALCDSCKKNKITVSYDRYNRSIKNTGSFVCKECIPEKRSQTIYRKYGDYNASKIDKFKEKMRQTNLERYGVPYYSQTKECLDKRMETMISKYGVSHNSQLPDYQEKYHNTCVERYGESYREYFTEKAFNAFYENTGYHNPSQSPEVKNRIRQTCIDKYGCEYNLQIPEVREKITKTLYANSSQKASRQQRYINSLYRGILNFPVKYYNVDIYLPDDKLAIEYDGGGHMLNVVAGRETIEEYNRKEIIRSNVIKNEGYKQMKIISNDDKLPSDTALLQMLQDTRNYFSDYPNHSWIEFNIDTSTVRNAENLHGIPYDFGALRRIKDEDMSKIENQTNLTKGA